MLYPSLFTPLKIGAHTLAHRVVMPPLTRMRAQTPGHTPHRLASEYYGQRATEGGLLIAEATQISQTGQGYPATPGIHTEEQVAGWRQVVDAVHAKGGVIFLQLWHVGRISHSSHQPGGAMPVAPSAIAAAGKAMSASFSFVPYDVPRALQTEEIAAIVADYGKAARLADAAGFDGVEIHAANGYLIDQFLEDHSNHRTDEYGGSIANRARLLAEVVDATSAVVGKDRVGVRMSPFGTVNDMGDSNAEAVFEHAIQLVSGKNVAYLHLIEPRSDAGGREVNNETVPLASSQFRSAFKGPMIASGGYAADSGAQAVYVGSADAIAFGRAFIANPDLVERLRTSAPLNPYNRSTFYGGDVEGYTDYPMLARRPALAPLS